MITRESPAKGEGKGEEERRGEERRKETKRSGQSNSNRKRNQIDEQASNRVGLQSRTRIA